MTANAISPATQQSRVQASGRGFIALPAASDPLTNPTSGVLVKTAGNMGLVMADGTDNNSALVAVTAGMYFPFQAVAVSSSNTAVLLGIN